MRAPVNLDGTLDDERVRAATAAVLAEPLYWFGVRHHSPNVARHLRAALRARQPKVIFLEAPAPAQSLIPHIVDAKTKPPVAIYVSYRDDANRFGWAGVTTPSPEIPARYASWYPMLPYSPEYVALVTARELRADVVFMDLPSYALIRPNEDRTSAPDSPDTDSPDSARASVSEEAAGGPSWERLVEGSSFYEALARAAGYRTWDETWDALFEQPSKHPDADAFRAEIAAFCAGVRATTPRRTLERDGTLARERFMWRTIRDELARRKLRPEDAAVVCGGFHLFLDREDATPPPPIPSDGTVYCTVAPYSFLRTSELTGYGAGNRAPRFYQRQWDAYDDRQSKGADPAVEAMVRHVVAVLAKGRKLTDGLSSADAIAVTQHARMIASLRGRTAPVLDDIRDALIACCCKGRLEEEGAPLVEAMQIAEVGTAVGRVTPALGQLPLVNDFYGQLDALGLDGVMGKEKKLKLALDLREELPARQSAFLHRLAFLEVPMGQLADRSGDSGMLFREQWTLAYSPGIEDALIEQTLYGDTVESAALARLQEQLATSARHAGETCKRLVAAVAMDLPALIVRLEAAAGHAIDEDKQFASLCEALVQLLVLDRLVAPGAFGPVARGPRTSTRPPAPEPRGPRRFARELIAELVRRCFAHACFAIPSIAGVPSQDQEAAIAHLKSLAEAVQGDAAAALDRDLFVENVTAAALAATVPFMQGAFAALLSELRVIDPVDLARRVAAFARARPETMVLAGEFLDGAFAVSKTSILLGAGELVAAIDELIRTASWDQFVVLLPRVRHAFERLHARQRMTFAERVAESYGLRDSQQIARLQTSEGAALQMAAIDAEVAAIMKEWTF